MAMPRHSIACALGVALVAPSSHFTVARRAQEGDGGIVRNREWVLRHPDEAAAYALENPEWAKAHPAATGDPARIHKHPDQAAAFARENPERAASHPNATQQISKHAADAKTPTSPEHVDAAAGATASQKIDLATAIFLVLGGMLVGLLLHFVARKVRDKRRKEERGREAARDDDAYIPNITMV